MTTRESNWLVLSRCAGALQSGLILDPADVQEVAACGVSTEEASLQLYIAGMGFDTENPAEAGLAERYLRKGIRKCGKQDYLQDAYRRSIRFPEKVRGRWSFAMADFAPYELFVRDDLLCLPDGREIPQLGYFTETFSYPVVRESGREWMTLAPVELETMREPIRQAAGDVVTLGLGLGYYAFHVSGKPEVKSLTVVERDPELIALFAEYLLPQFPCREKIRLVCGDAFRYLQQMRNLPDQVFCDLWHDAGDGVPMYLALRDIAGRMPEVSFTYWIERSLQARIRMLQEDQDD